MSDFRLKVFRSTARHLSFTKAADEMCISQPAVTRHIKEIESEYGQRVFERTNGRLILTKAGSTLLEHAERILEQYDTLDFEMKRLRGEYAGELKIGASTTIAQYILPAALADFATRHPDINLLLLNGNTTEVEEALIRHDIDLGLVEGISRQLPLHYTAWLKDELVAVVRANGSLARKEEITTDELSTIPLVLREPGSGTLAVWHSALQHKGIPENTLHVIAQSGNSESIKRFISRYDAMEILSIRSVHQEILNGQLKIVEIKDLPLQRVFHIVQRQGQESGLTEKFLTYLHKCENSL